MKKILFIVLVIVSVIEAKPCMTDIYFGNGVWNDEDAVIKSRDYLKKFMLYKANVRLNPSKNEVDYRFGYVHNPSHGTTNDLIETFWQLKESGQIDYGLFWAKSATLATITGSNGETEIRETINQIVSQYNNDIIPILHAYQGSFNQKHNVLLVAHSQGNLFGNKIYELLSDTQQKKFRMVSVATPASYVKIKGQTSPYVTVSLDYVIGAIPNSLPGNVDGRGHTFLGTYLSVKGEGLAIDTGSIRAPRKIALYVKSAYDNLMQTTSCTEYTFVRVLMLSFGNVKIFGRPVGQGYGEDFISEVSLEQSDATFNSSTNKWQCGGQTTLYSNTVGSDGVNWAWGSYADEFGEVYSGAFGWLPGRLHSYDELQSRSTIKEEMLLVGKNQCVTMSLKKESLLYSAIEKIFPKK